MIILFSFITIQLKTFRPFQPTVTSSQSYSSPVTSVGGAGGPTKFDRSASLLDGTSHGLTLDDIPLDFKPSFDTS